MTISLVFVSAVISVFYYIRKKVDGGYTCILTVPGSTQLVVAQDERVVWNETYIALKDVKDLIHSGVLDFDWAFTATYGPLGGIVLNLSDTEMIATYGWNCPSTSDLEDVFNYVFTHPKPVLSGMCSFLLMYPPGGDIEPAVLALTSYQLNNLYKRGIRRFIIWDGTISSGALIQWLEQLEKEFTLEPVEDFLGSWMCAEEDNLGMLGELFSFIWWKGQVKVWFLFYGVDIQLASPRQVGEAHRHRLQSSGLLQYPHWFFSD